VSHLTHLVQEDVSKHFQIHPRWILGRSTPNCPVISSSGSSAELDKPGMIILRALVVPCPEDPCMVYCIGDGSEILLPS